MGAGATQPMATGGQAAASTMTGGQNPWSGQSFQTTSPASKAGQTLASGGKGGGQASSQQPNYGTGAGTGGQNAAGGKGGGQVGNAQPSFGPGTPGYHGPGDGVSSPAPSTGGGLVTTMDMVTDPNTGQQVSRSQYYNNYGNFGPSPARQGLGESLASPTGAGSSGMNFNPQRTFGPYGEQDYNPYHGGGIISPAPGYTIPTPIRRVPSVLQPGGAVSPPPNTQTPAPTPAPAPTPPNVGAPPPPPPAPDAAAGMMDPAQFQEMLKNAYDPMTGCLQSDERCKARFWINQGG